MRFNLANRKTHYWVAIACALPLAVITASGLLLQLKKHWTWVQPPERRGTGTVPALSLEDVLAAARTVSHLDVRGWDDVNRIDLRPGRGVAKVWLKNGWEVQVCLGTGAVLQAAYRRSDLIESIHDGSFFGGDAVKLGLFLPAGVALALLWASGLWMFGVTWLGRRRLRSAGGRPRA
jgi:uncharacterized iron-regulated membrane protein